MSQTTHDRVTVTLSPDQLKTVYAHGRERDNLHAEANSFIDREKTHIRGLKGEIAVAEYYGLETDLELRPTGDNGIDFTCWWLLCPVQVDVKTTEYVSNPWLKVKADGHKTADVYILTVDDGADIELVGWAWLRDVEATDPTQETGHHTNHVLKPSDLRTMPKPQQVDPRDNER
jgi:hypothetical protein